MYQLSKSASRYFVQSFYDLTIIFGNKFWCNRGLQKYWYIQGILLTVTSTVENNYKIRNNFFILWYFRLIDLSVSQSVILSKATCSKQKSMVNSTYSNHFVPFEVLLGIFVWFSNSKHILFNIDMYRKNTLFRPFSGNTTWYPFGRDVTRPCFKDFPRVYWIVFYSTGKCIVTQYVSSSTGHSSFAQSVLGQNGPWAK